MPRRICVVKGCTAHSRWSKEKNGFRPTMYPAPKDPAMFAKWSQAVPWRNIERPLRPTDHVCMKHFKPGEIELNFVHKIGNVTHLIEKSKPRLRPGLVPSVFPSPDGTCTDTDNAAPLTYLRDSRHAVDPLGDEQVIIITPRSPQGPLEIDLSTTDEVIPSADNNELQTMFIEPFGHGDRFDSFTDLLDLASTIRLPDTLWGHHASHNMLAFSRFSSRLFDKGVFCDRGVVFRDSLSPMLLVRGRETECPVLAALVTSVIDVEEVLTVVGRLMLCRGNKRCSGDVREFSDRCEGISDGAECRECGKIGAKTVESKLEKLGQQLKQARMKLKSHTRTARQVQKKAEVRRAKYDQQFLAFCMFEDSASDGTVISLSKINKWFQQARVYRNTTITARDVGNAFKYFKVRALFKEEFMTFVTNLATQHNVAAQEVVDMLVRCRSPKKTRQAVKKKVVVAVVPPTEPSVESTSTAEPNINLPTT